VLTNAATVPDTRAVPQPLSAHPNPRSAAAAESRAARANWLAASVVTVLAAVIPAVLWVGDISFMQDEPRLLAKAFHANARHTIEAKGLNGNFGVPYGPLPTHVYQILLLFTHDPIKVAGIHAALITFVTAISLLWLARTLRLNPWFATAVVLAPYVWNFQRLMWDANYAMPIGCLAMAAYASFVRTGKGAPLLTAITSSIALAFIHPQDLPVLAPILMHVLWRYPRALAKHYAGIAIILGVTFALNFAYFREAYYAVAWQLDHHTMRSAYPGQEKATRSGSLLKPLLGGTILGGEVYARDDSRLVERPQLVRIAQIASNLSYPLIWLGIVAMIVRLCRRGRDPDDEDQHDASLAKTQRTIFAIALAGLVLQMLLYGVMRMPALPQYFFGTLILHILFAWVGVEALRRVRLNWVALVLYGVGCAYLTFASAEYIHRVGYARHTYRPSLADQVTVARELNRYADEAVLTDVQLFKSHPQSIRSLRLLLPPKPGEAQTTSGRLMVRHSSGPTGNDSRIELIELEPGTPLPFDAEVLEVTPLPKDWQPAKW
jgi:hypothetical protein